LRAFARWSETAVEKQFIETDFFRRMFHAIVIAPLSVQCVQALAKKKLIYAVSVFSTELCTVVLKNSSSVNGDVGREVPEA